MPTTDANPSNYCPSTAVIRRPFGGVLGWRPVPTNSYTGIATPSSPSPTGFGRTVSFRERKFGGSSRRRLPMTKQRPPIVN